MLLYPKSYLCFYRTLKNRENGTFVLRRSQPSEDQTCQQQEEHFVLSFHFGQMVYHVNVKEPGNGRPALEMGGVLVNLVTFVEMVDYFRQVPIFKTLCLTQKHGGNSETLVMQKSENADVNEPNDDIDTLKE